MQPVQHPNDDVVMRYAAATLSEGVSLVIGVHVAMCDRCRALVRTFQSVGGAILDELEPVQLAPSAYAKVLQRINSGEQIRARAPIAEARIAPGLDVPAAMRPYRIGRWRALAPGLKFSRVTSPTDSNMNVFMLRAAPGASLADHGHTGDEYLCVLKGSFSDQSGRHRPGDMAIADAETEHRPIVDADSECICVVALEGKLRLRSVAGRLLQPVYGL